MYARRIEGKTVREVSHSYGFWRRWIFLTTHSSTLCRIKPTPPHSLDSLTTILYLAHQPPRSKVNNPPEPHTHALTTVKIANPSAVDRTFLGMTLSNPLLPVSTNERKILAAFLHSAGSATEEVGGGEEVGKGER